MTQKYTDIFSALARHEDEISKTGSVFTPLYEPCYALEGGPAPAESTEQSQAPTLGDEPSSPAVNQDHEWGAPILLAEADTSAEPEEDPEGIDEVASLLANELDALFDESQGEGELATPSHIIDATSVAGPVVDHPPRPPWSVDPEPPEGSLSWFELISDPLHLFWRERELTTEERQLDYHLEVLERLTSIVGDLHAQGLTHRDLNPRHVLICPSESILLTGRASTLNHLALAEVGPQEDASVGVCDQLVGTPAFMPIELAFMDLDAQGPWTDTYSLGAIAYYILTTRPLIRSMDATALASGLMSPEPYQALESLSDEYNDLLERSVAPDPNDRYEDTTLLLQDLRAARSSRLASRFERRGQSALTQLIKLEERFRHQPEDLSVGSARSEDVKLLRLYHEAERSFWTAQQLDSKRLSSTDGLQETLTLRIRQLARLGDLRGARALYQELPQAQPNLLLELEEAWTDTLKRSADHLHVASGPEPSAHLMFKEEGEVDALEIDGELSFESAEPQGLTALPLPSMPSESALPSVEGFFEVEEHQVPDASERQQSEPSLPSLPTVAGHHEERAGTLGEIDDDVELQDTSFDLQVNLPENAEPVGEVASSDAPEQISEAEIEGFEVLEEVEAIEEVHGQSLNEAPVERPVSTPPPFIDAGLLPERSADEHESYENHEILAPLMTPSASQLPVQEAAQGDSLGMQLDQIQGLFGGASQVSLDDFSEPSDSSIEERYELPSAMPIPMPVDDYEEDEDPILPFKSGFKTPLPDQRVPMNIIAGGEVSPEVSQEGATASLVPPVASRSGLKQALTFLFIAPIFLSLGVLASPSGRAYITSLIYQLRASSPQANKTETTRRPAPRTPTPLPQTRPTPRPKPAPQALVTSSEQAQVPAPDGLDTKAEAETQAHMEAEARTQALKEAEAKAKAQAEAEAKAQAEAEAKAQAEAEAKAQAEAEAKSQAEEEARAQAEEEARASRRSERRSDEIDVFSSASLKNLDKGLPYTVLIASFRTVDEAMTLASTVQKMESLGAVPWILEVDLKAKGKRYRVLVGRLESSAEAKVVSKQLRSVSRNPMIRSWTRWQ